MAWANEEIAGLLREYAELTRFTGGDVFRAAARHRAEHRNTWPLDKLRAFLRKDR